AFRDWWLRRWDSREKNQKYPSSEGASSTHSRDEQKCWSSCSMRADRSKQAGQDDPQPSVRDMQIHYTLRWIAVVVLFCLLSRNRHLPCCWSCKATESKGVREPLESAVHRAMQSTSVSVSLVHRPVLRLLTQISIFPKPL
ncbi:hypothetical protein CTAM01_05195, partial [Colletotrichum tamarilloi]